MDFGESIANPIGVFVCDVEIDAGLLGGEEFLVNGASDDIARGELPFN